MMTHHESVSFLLTDDLSMRELQRAYAIWMLEQCHGNKAATCRRLGIAFNTLQGYLARTERKEAA